MLHARNWPYLRLMLECVALGNEIEPFGVINEMK